MNISKIIKATFSLILLFCVLACAGKRIITEDESIINTNPKLLFLNLNIVKKGNQKHISLINQITTDGKLKGTFKNEVHTDAGDLELIILDKDLNKIDAHSIKNPLLKTIEFINDNGEFEKKMLDLDSTQFSYRMQLRSTAKYVVINEITTTKTKQHFRVKIE